MWWTQSYDAQGMLVEFILTEKSFDDLEFMGSGVSLSLQSSERAVKTFEKEFFFWYSTCLETLWDEFYGGVQSLS